MSPRSGCTLGLCCVQARSSLGAEPLLRMQLRHPHAPGLYLGLRFVNSAADRVVLGRRKQRRKDGTCSVPEALIQNWLHLLCFIRNWERRERQAKLKNLHFSKLYIPCKHRLSLKTKQRAIRAHLCFRVQSSYAWCCTNAIS